MDKLEALKKELGIVRRCSSERIKKELFKTLEPDMRMAYSFVACMTGEIEFDLPNIGKIVMVDTFAGYRPGAGAIEVPGGGMHIEQTEEGRIKIVVSH